MTDKLLIERELLERAALLLKDGTQPPEGCANFDDWTAQGDKVSAELRAILAAPRQPEGDGLEVVAYECLSGLHVSLSYEPFGNDPVPLWRAPDAQRAIAELRKECGRVKSENDHLARHINKMITERDTLRQQLADSEAHLKHARRCIQHMIDQTTPLVPDPSNPGWAKRIQLDEVIAQRDKLAQILRDLVPGCKWRHMRPRINTALAEVDALTSDSGVGEP